jgi:hypothetical protein
LAAWADWVAAHLIDKLEEDNGRGDVTTFGTVEDTLPQAVYGNINFVLLKVPIEAKEFDS